MAKQERAIATREALVAAAGRVFAAKHFETARVADILTEAGITQGAFYFHFPEGKKQIAEELIQRQDAQFIQLRDELFNSDLDGLSAILALSDALGQALHADPVTQAGIRLVTQASTTFPDAAKLPDPTWIDAITTLLDRARNDGGLHDDVDIPAAAYSLVYLFTGAQVSSFVNDNWTNVQHILHAIEPFVLRALTAPGFTPRNHEQNAWGANHSETA
ncbi:TetR/AcrR family transcriptional regulator [Microbacterium resistens]|uniref:TetR/AcrR family transcriptional regulator n=1 Tax=Microbacterium resistens TaxID=156977 RepID=UPI001C579264|nr:TetR/AcrR family transcriptional regulator [Microbacterium resistens]MBW1637816.1 TetR/AcrR family transcriptional regulator [Microbacterium resistens]